MNAPLLLVWAIVVVPALAAYLWGCWRLLQLLDDVISRRADAARIREAEQDVPA